MFNWFKQKDPLEKMWEDLVEMEAKVLSKRAAYDKFEACVGGNNFFDREELTSKIQDLTYWENKLHHYKERFSKMLKEREDEKEFLRRMGFYDV
jgi:hypothetical protein